MDTAPILAGIAAVHLLAAMSPGPSFVLSVRTAAGRGRGAALWMAAGIGLGALVWAAAAMFGLSALFAAAPWLRRALQMAGAAYLIWIAVALWRHADAPARLEAGALPLGPLAAFRQALAVQLANPKVMVFFGSIFVTVLPADPSPALRAAILGNVLAVETAWYVIVALAFSCAPVRARYLRAKGWLDRGCGGLMGLLGLRLALAA